jgi:hypothetical protein
MSSVKNQKEESHHSKRNRQHDGWYHPPVERPNVGRVSSRMNLSPTKSETPIEQKADHRSDEKKTDKIVGQPDRAVKDSREHKSTANIHQNVLGKRRPHDI